MPFKSLDKSSHNARKNDGFVSKRIEFLCQYFKVDFSFWNKVRKKGEAKIHETNKVGVKSGR